MSPSWHGDFGRFLTGQQIFIIFNIPKYIFTFQIPSNFLKLVLYVQMFFNFRKIGYGLGFQQVNEEEIIAAEMRNCLEDLDVEMKSRLSVISAYACRR